MRNVVLAVSLILAICLVAFAIGETTGEFVYSEGVVRDKSNFNGRYTRNCFVEVEGETFRGQFQIKCSAYDLIIKGDRVNVRWRKGRFTNLTHEEYAY